MERRILTIDIILEDLDEERNESFGIFAVRYPFRSYNVDRVDTAQLKKLGYTWDYYQDDDGTTVGWEICSVLARKAKYIANQYSQLNIKEREIFLKMIEGIEVDG